MFCRVEVTKVRAIGPGRGGSEVALLADDGRVAPLIIVEACLVDLQTVRLLFDVDSRYCKCDLHPSESRGSPI